MEVTLQMVDDDLDDLEVWYANKLAEIKQALLVPVRNEIKQQNKNMRNKYLAHRRRLKQLRETVQNQPIRLAAVPEPDDGDNTDETRGAGK